MALKSVPPVTFSPRIILSFTGFQIFEPAGGSNAWPFFHVVGSKGPVFMAPVGGTLRALLSRPACAASGNCVAPACALFAYGSATAGCCDAGGCDAGGCGVCPANAAMPSAPESSTTAAIR